jgi:type III secretion system YscQ/HrcQ family protein
MMVRSFELQGLPHFSAAGIDTARSAAVRLQDADQRVIEVKLAPFGVVKLRCLDVTPPDEPEDSAAIWSLARTDGDRRQGYLVLDGLTALRLVAVTLGLPAPRALRALGAAERGIVAATIATLFHVSACDVVVALAPKPWRPEGLARLVIEADLGGYRERVRLDVPPAWIPPKASTHLVENATRRGLGIPLVVELARTMLTAGDWARARSGDAIVFDDHDALAPDREWPTRIVCGEFTAEALLANDGRATMNGGFQTDDDAAKLRAAGTHDIWKTGREIMSSDEQQASSVTMLASAPIQVIAELGRLVLRADEVVALRPGSILTLGSLRPTTVDLRVGDHSWGHGELVNVDGQLGVRLTALASDPSPRSSVNASEAQTLR